MTDWPSTLPGRYSMAPLLRTIDPSLLTTTSAAYDAVRVVTKVVAAVWTCWVSLDSLIHSREFEQRLIGGLEHSVRFDSGPRQ